ncbi:MAG: hypothetical protein ACK4JE_05025 [Endomicrobiia bacterium]
MKTRILMIDKNDKNSEEKEIEFNVEYLLSLSLKQRFKKFFRLCDFINSLMKNYGHRKTNRRNKPNFSTRC